MAHFKSNQRGGLSVDRDSLHASPEFKRQIAALNKLSENHMTLPQNVKDAVRQLDESIGNWGIRRDAWQTIRAHLMSQEAEIARLNRLWESMTNLAVKKDSQIKIAESRLAAANALLRECHCYFETRSVDSRTIGESLSLNEKIQSHLQGAGDEA